MRVEAYVQGRNGEEWECKVTQPEPTDAKLDKCIFIPAKALIAMADPDLQDPDYFWVRVVSVE